MACTREWRRCSYKPEKQYTGPTSTDITDYVRRCLLCTTHKATHPIKPMAAPWHPRQPIAKDYSWLFNHKGRDYLLICDLFGKYPFLYKITTKSAWSLIQKIQELIALYGPQDPSTPITDHPHLKRVQAIPAMPMDQACNLFPLPPLVQQLHWVAGLNAQDCPQHHTRCQNHPQRPTPQTAIDAYQSLYAHPKGHSLQLDHTPPRQAFNSSWHVTGYKLYILSKKLLQKHYFNHSHNVKPLLQPSPGQEAIFLFTADWKSYIPRTINDKASISHSYITEAQGKQFPQD